MLRTDTRAYIIDALQVSAVCFIIATLLKIFEEKDIQDSNIAKTLIEQSHKWHTISVQDKQLLYSMMHSNYAVAYLNAARHASNDTNLERLTGIDIHKLYKKIDDHQQKTTKEMFTKLHPKTKVKNIHAQSAWV